MGGAAELVERDEEVAVLRAAIEASRTGQGHLVLAAAAAGLGKTSLLDAARTLAAEAGLLVLTARGSELERDFPFGTVRQLLDPVLLARTRDEAWQGAARLAGPLPDDGSAQVGGADLGYARLHGMYWLLAGLAQEQPLLVAVDDAHWLDPASLRFLCFLARRLEGLPLLLLVAFRPGEADAQERLLADLVDQPATLLRPRPLSEEGVAALVATRLTHAPDPVFVQACTSTTGGNPFYLRALLAEMAERRIAPVAANAHAVPGLRPTEVSRYLLRRLGALPACATALARAVAVLGDHADLTQLCELAALDRSRLSEAAQALRDVAIFSSMERPAFAHPIARSAVYTAIPPVERAALHGCAAQLLLTADAAAEQVAAQLLGVEPGSRPEAVQIMKRAAATASARGAPEAAAGYLRRALAEPLHGVERTALLVDLGQCEAYAGLPEAPARLRRALSREDLPAEARVAASVALARLLIAHGNGPEAADVLLQQIKTLAAHPRLAARLDAELLAVANIDLGVRPAVHGRAAGLVYDSVADESLAAAVAAYRAVDDTLSGASAQTAAWWAERALAGGLLRADAMTGGQNLIYVNLCLITAGRYDLVAQQLEAALTDARLSGSAAPFVILCVLRAKLACRTGALGDAEADGRVALEAARLNGYRLLELLALADLVDVATETGELCEVATWLSAAWVDEMAAATPQANTALEARGRLRLFHGETAAGVADLLQAGERFVRWGLRNPSLYRWRSSAALGLAALGERHRALALVGEELDLARAWGTPREIGISLRAAGQLQRRSRQLELLGEAVAVLARSPAVLEHAHALTDLGAAMRRAGRLSEARGALREALTLAVGCGSTVLANRARSELRAAGGRPRTPRAGGPVALTASEQRIAELAAAGATNPAIAQSLFVTVKTVEMHLSSAYRKLGVRSRSDLGQALHDSGSPRAGPRNRG